jgi:hypothetical protein
VGLLNQVRGALWTELRFLFFSCNLLKAYPLDKWTPFGQGINHCYTINAPMLCIFLYFVPHLDSKYTKFQHLHTKTCGHKSIIISKNLSLATKTSKFHKMKKFNFFNRQVCLILTDTSNFIKFKNWYVDQSSLLRVSYFSTYTSK